MKRLRNSHGLTLTEVLATVAIIAILCAIALPRFAGWREASQKSVCDANCADLQQLMTTWQLKHRLSSGDPKTIAEFDSVKTQYTCPTAGRCDYEFNSATGRVYCATHVSGGTDGGYPGNPFVSISSALQAIGVIDSDGYTTGTASAGYQKFNQLDSSVNSASSEAGYSGTNYPQTLSAVQDAVGDSAVSWAIRSTSYNGKNYYQISWSAQDVTAMKVGDVVYTMKYNTGGANAGQYSIWQASVTTKNDKNGKAFLVLTTPTAASSELKSLYTDSEKSDYNRMRAVYNQYLSDRGIIS